MERTLRTPIPGPGADLMAPVPGLPPAVEGGTSSPAPDQAPPRTALGIVLTALRGDLGDAAPRRRRAHRERQAAEQTERLLRTGLHHLR
ncbi:hypothetical protein NLU66_14480 [Brachybacterium sp. NBEC-018]|uniref:hypothetical protein n=1 Tax=Brachybacterium sp. NBEC-018 TaxID=2996004 RepID=UPI0021751CF3|nr:hypothetical protein [Brachybacterium sp. NBEC-018]UVY83407.1 hypothetical protein NLU66_14480 [Brachybacterium sp. NBEC-018]